MQFNDLIGKTIKAIQKLKLKEYDDKGYLLMEFADGSKALIVAGYDGYTGNSREEYPTYLSISDVADEGELARFEAITK